MPKKKFATTASRQQLHVDFAALGNINAVAKKHNIAWDTAARIVAPEKYPKKTENQAKVAEANQVLNGKPAAPLPMTTPPLPIPQWDVNEYLNNLVEDFVGKVRTLAPDITSVNVRFTRSVEYNAVTSRVEVPIIERTPK